MARPYKLTPDVHRHIVDAVSAAVPIDIAAASVGITDSTYYRWMKHGREEFERRQAGHEPDETRNHVCELYQAIQEAEARAQATILVEWRQQAKGDWRAGKEMLARRWPERYASARERGELDVSGTVAHVDAGLLTEAAEAMLGVLPAEFREAAAEAFALWLEGKDVEVVDVSVAEPPALEAGS